MPRANKAQRNGVGFTEQELRDFERGDITCTLTEKEQRFCEEYTKSLNLKQAAMNAGYSPKTAPTMAYTLRQREDINLYIAWLKLALADDIKLQAKDFIGQYIKIAFADMTDYLREDNKGYIQVKNLKKIDGQLIKKVTKNKNGFLVELYSKEWAFNKLEKYFELLPPDWRQKVSEERLALEKEKLELEKEKQGVLKEEFKDDGLIAALKAAANGLNFEEEVKQAEAYTEEDEWEELIEEEDEWEDE